MLSARSGEHHRPDVAQGGLEPHLPEDECWEERLALRDAFVDSLAPPQ